MNKKLNNLQKLIKARRASRLSMTTAKKKSAAPANAPKALDPIDQPKDEAPVPEAPAEETPAPSADVPTEVSEPASIESEAPVEEAVEQPAEQPAEEPVAEPAEETAEAVEAPKKKKSYYKSKKKS